MNKFTFELRCDAPILEAGKRYCFYGMPQKTTRVLEVELTPETEAIYVDGSSNKLPDTTRVIVPVGHVFACVVKLRVGCSDLVLTARGLKHRLKEFPMKTDFVPDIFGACVVALLIVVSAQNGCASVAARGAPDRAKLQAVEDQFCSDIQALLKVDLRVQAEAALCDKIGILRAVEKDTGTLPDAGDGGK